MVKTPKGERPKHDSWHLFGCALLCFVVFVAMIFKPILGVGIILVLILFSVFYVKFISRPNPEVMAEYALYESILAETNSLPYDDVRTTVEALLDGVDVFQIQHAETPLVNLEQYPPSIRRLFSRYACISIYELSIGTDLPEKLWGEDPVVEFIVREPYQLIGTDYYIDGDGAPIVVKDGEEAVYTLETSDEPDPGEQFISPSIYHLLLTRARFVQKS
ncbi:MAG: hypothetical protein BWY76_00155 [bacterium ADurb.Bin429]|nr:MAG: hypothetical protein BWY76_00155 [bacterium ADurb.Bin429]